MFGTVANILQPAKIESQHFGFLETFGLELKVLRMESAYVSKFFISGCLLRTTSVRKLGIPDNLHAYMYI